MMALSTSVNPRSLGLLRPSASNSTIFFRQECFSSLTRKNFLFSLRMRKHNDLLSGMFDGKSRSSSIRYATSNGAITQQDCTDMAWQGMVTSSEVAKENKHQIVETEHLMKALLEQKSGIASRIFSKVGVDNTHLVEFADRFIECQPKVKVRSIIDVFA